MWKRRAIRLTWRYVIASTLKRHRHDHMADRAKMYWTIAVISFTEIPFDFSQKYQTVPRPNRSATVYFGTQFISVGCILLKNLNVGPANRPAFCRQVPLFYAKCPSKNILQVGRSAQPPSKWILFVKKMIDPYDGTMSITGVLRVQHNTYYVTIALTTTVARHADFKQDEHAGNPRDVTTDSVNVGLMH